MTIALWSPKGGSGTSVTAAALALLLARSGGARLVDLAGDQPAILGMAQEPDHGVGDWLRSGSSGEALDRLGVEGAPHLVLLGQGDPAVLDGRGGDSHPQVEQLLNRLDGDARTVVDAGRAHGRVRREIVSVSTSLVVVRGCYLALRRGLADELVRSATGVVLVDEPGRALRDRDVAAVLEVPVLTRIPARASIARAVDAGTLVSRIPDVLTRSLDRLLDTLASNVGAVA